MSCGSFRLWFARLVADGSGTQGVDISLINWAENVQYIHPVLSARSLSYRSIHPRPLPRNSSRSHTNPLSLEECLPNQQGGSTKPPRNQARICQGRTVPDLSLVENTSMTHLRPNLSPYLPTHPIPQLLVPCSVLFFFRRTDPQPQTAKHKHRRRKSHGRQRQANSPHHLTFLKPTMCE